VGGACVPGRSGARIGWEKKKLNRGVGAVDARGKKGVNTVYLGG